MSWFYIYKEKCEIQIIFLLEGKYAAEVSSLCAKAACGLLTLGLSPEVASSCGVWIFTMLLRRCMGNCGDWRLLACGWAVKASEKMLPSWDNWTVSIKPGSAPECRLRSRLSSEVIDSSAHWSCSTTLCGKEPFCFPLHSGAWLFQPDCSYRL